MKLTPQQFKELQPYERNFFTAINADWSRHPGMVGVRVINDVYCDVFHTKRTTNAGCQSCVIELLRDMGRVYFAYKEEMENKVKSSKKKK